MCGRYAFKLTWAQLHDLLAFGLFPESLNQQLQPSFNVAPTHDCAIVAQRDHQRELLLARWGFVPTWWSAAEPPKHTINARSETAGTSNMFRAAFKASRCLVPASGYFEWQTLPGGGKSPVFIARADQAPLLMGGVHACTANQPTFAVLTTSAPTGLEAIHDRSPVILEPEAAARWLDPATPPDEIQALCRPAADGVLTFHRVSKAVGNVRNNSPELIRPLPPETLFG